MNFIVKKKKILSNAIIIYMFIYAWSILWHILFTYYVDTGH